MIRLRHGASMRARFFCSIGEGGGDGGTGGGGGGGGGTGGGTGGTGGSAGGTGSGGTGDPWYQSHVATLDKDTLAWLDGKKFADPVAALKSGAQADKIARDRNVISKPDPAKLGEWDGWTALGYEPDAAKYKGGIKAPELSKGVAMDPAIVDAFASITHGLKLPASIAQPLLDGVGKFFGERLQGIEANGAKATADLQVALDKEWGNDRAVNEEIAKRAARTLGIGADDLKELEGLVKSPRLMKLMHKLGTTALEGKLVTDDTGGGAAGMTPARAEAELRRLQGDAAWMKVFGDPGHPQQADYAAQRQALLETIAKGRKKAA